MIFLFKDEQNEENFENLFDALLIFENDTRFHEHINCFERIFSVPSHIILKDFYSLKEMKKEVKLCNKFHDQAFHVAETGKFENFRFLENFWLEFAEN